MDRPIDSAVMEGRKRRRWITLAGAAAVLVLLMALLPAWVRPAVERGRLRTGRVDRGPIEMTLSAAGTVVPEVERTIVAPGPSRVLRLLKQPGDSVAVGEPILELDNGASRLTVERLTRQMAMKENEREQARVDQDNRLSELRTQSDIKSLELKSKQFDVERNTKLKEMGVISGDVLRQSQNDTERLAIEIAELTRRAANADRELAVRLKSLDLEYDILAKERDEAARVLDRGTASSDIAGVLTWVLGTEGTAVNAGDELARVADLDRFKVDATLSDVYAARIRPGMPAFVAAGEARLPGRVSRVLPTVDVGTLRLEVALDDQSNAVLRHNLRVEAHVIVDRREGALRVARGTFPTIDGNLCAFVVRGDRAVRRPIRLGLTGWEAAEILEGLNEGDEVVLSDMSEYLNQKEIRIR
ncbi:MAG TPA: HlyD family efflux transporter periplasmic adaptor subunit [Candidatus Eisenbacteria bacterium]